MSNYPTIPPPQNQITAFPPSPSPSPPPPPPPRPNTYQLPDLHLDNNPYSDPNVHFPTAANGPKPKPRPSPAPPPTPVDTLTTVPTATNPTQHDYIPPKHTPKPLPKPHSPQKTPSLSGPEHPDPKTPPPTPTRPLSPKKCGINTLTFPKDDKTLANGLKPVQLDYIPPKPTPRPPPKPHSPRKKTVSGDFPTAGRKVKGGFGGVTLEEGQPKPKPPPRPCSPRRRDVWMSARGVVVC